MLLALRWFLPSITAPREAARQRTMLRGSAQLQEGDFNEADFDFSAFNDVILEEAGRIADAKAAAEEARKKEESAVGWSALEARLPLPTSPLSSLALSDRTMRTAAELRAAVEAATPSREAKVAAARAVIGSRVPLVEGASGAKGTSLGFEEGDEYCVDEMLREVCRRLLATYADPMDGSRPHIRDHGIVDELDTSEPFRAKLWAQSAKFFASRLMSPADLDLQVLLSTLLKLSSEAEAIAWRGSGGLL